MSPVNDELKIIYIYRQSTIYLQFLVSGSFVAKNGAFIINIYNPICYSLLMFYFSESLLRSEVTSKQAGCLLKKESTYSITRPEQNQLISAILFIFSYRWHLNMFEDIAMQYHVAGVTAWMDIKLFIPSLDKL